MRNTLSVIVLLAGASLIPVKGWCASDPLHIWSTRADPAALDAWVDAHLNAARSQIDKLIAVEGPRTVDNTVRPFDDANNELAIAGNEANAMVSLGTTAVFRDQAQALSQKVASAATALSLNRQVYDALGTVPTASLDKPTRHLIKRALLEFKLSGVDKDDATRARIQALQDEITETALLFNRNISDDVRKVTASAAETKGLPADFIHQHKPDEKGMYTFTTDEPDVGPVTAFASNAELRRRMFLAYDSRAYPANQPVLMSLLKQRYELANLLGFKSFAELDTADEMLNSPARVKALLEQVDTVTREPAQREYARLLTFARTREANLTEIAQPDVAYWNELYRRATYQFDAQSVRPYFPYDAVQAGVLKTAGRLFHLEFKAQGGLALWDTSVAAFDVIDRNRVIGRIYLDMHPREGKDKWFSSVPLVPGIRGRQLPEGALMCNFPGGMAGDPGLMSYEDVVTYFHEFGHLMHQILSGDTEWSLQQGFNVEQDFVEAPSQMLEEFFRDPKLLATFARRTDTGEPIPAELVARMNAASAFGRAAAWQRQVLYATYSLQIYDEDPANVDLDQLMKADIRHYSPYQSVGDERGYAAFSHLSDYGSKYYTYVLDKVIAIDFFAQFDGHDLIDGPTAMRYRHDVLEPGSSRAADSLVREFLGRPENLDAFKEWLNVEFLPTPSAAP